MADASDDLSWLVYTSFAAEEFDAERLDALLAQSRRNNETNDVTGLLLFKDQRFLQALEGRREVISDLMDTIAGDRRHIDVYVLLEEPLSERHFPSWAMGYQTWSHEDSAWPSDHVVAFRGLASGPPSDETRGAVRELFTWFQERTDTDPVAAAGSDPHGADAAADSRTTAEESVA